MRPRGKSIAARSKRDSRFCRSRKFAPVAAASAIAAAGGSVGGGTVGVLSARALLSVDAALLTLLLCRCLSGFTSTRFFTQPVRAAIADFGPVCEVSRHPLSGVSDPQLGVGDTWDGEDRVVVCRCARASAVIVRQ